MLYPRAKFTSGPTRSVHGNAQCPIPIRRQYNIYEHMVVKFYMPGEEGASLEQLAYGMVKKIARQMNEFHEPSAFCKYCRVSTKLPSWGLQQEFAASANLLSLYAVAILKLLL